MMNMKDVVVTGIGVMCSIGNNKEEFFDSLLSARHGVTPFTKDEYPKHPFGNKKISTLAGRIKGFEPEEHFPEEDLQRFDLPVLAILETVGEALKDRGRPLEEVEVTVIVGSAIEIRPEYNRMFKNIKMYTSGNRDLAPKPRFYRAPAMESMNDSVLSAVFRKFHLKGDGFTVQQICTSGTAILSYGADYIRHDQAQIVICISFDLFHPMHNILFSNLNLMGRERCISFDKSETKCPLGEGVGVAILESLDSAREKETNIWGKLRGYGITNEAYHIVMPPPSPRDFARAIELSIEDARLDHPEKIDFATLTGKGLKNTDLKELKGLKMALGDPADKILINSIVPYTGYAFSASAMLSVIMALLQMKKGVVLPIPNFKTPYSGLEEMNYVREIIEKETCLSLVCSVAFAGINTAIILEKL